MNNDLSALIGEAVYESLQHDRAKTSQDSPILRDVLVGVVKDMASQLNASVGFWNDPYVSVEVEVDEHVHFRDTAVVRHPTELAATADAATTLYRRDPRNTRNFVRLGCCDGHLGTHIEGRRGEASKE
jgi:hypothetical protein